MFNKIVPKVGQVVKTGGERYDAYNAGSTALKAGDAVELVEVKYGRIGVKKIDTGECIGFVVSETIDREYKAGAEFTYASSHSFIALNAVTAIDVGDKVKAGATGVSEATLPADAALVVGTAYSKAAIAEVVVIKLSVN